MTAPRSAAALLLALVALPAAAASAADDEKAPKRKVLVELYTSQGCDSCPSANDLLGRLAKLGYGPDRVVPVSFHVDYFNTPWVDPFSTNDFSRREMSYNAVMKRNDLYFTPMMMVDGRYPMLGSNKPEATAAIERSLKAKPAVAIKLAVDGSGAEKQARVEVRRLLAEVDARPLQLCVALTEGPIATKVDSGENAGKTLVEPAIVRSFGFRNFKLDGREPRALGVPLKLAADSKPERCRVAAWVQDFETGRAYQAESIAWAEEKAEPRVAAGSSGR